ncbi:hypothetical protein CapIbe_017805 [Capra ibex]
MDAAAAGLSSRARRPLLEGQLFTPLRHSIGQILDETFQVATWEADALTLRTNRGLVHAAVMELLTGPLTLSPACSPTSS